MRGLKDRAREFRVEFPGGDLEESPQRPATSVLNTFVWAIVRGRATYAHIVLPVARHKPAGQRVYHGNGRMETSANREGSVANDDQPG